MGPNIIGHPPDVWSSRILIAWNDTTTTTFRETPPPQRIWFNFSNSRDGRDRYYFHSESRRRCNIYFHRYPPIISVHSHEPRTLFSSSRRLMVILLPDLPITTQRRAPLEMALRSWFLEGPTAEDLNLTISCSMPRLPVPARRSTFYILHLSEISRRRINFTNMARRLATRICEQQNDNETGVLSID